MYLIQRLFLSASGSEYGITKFLRKRLPAAKHHDLLKNFFQTEHSRHRSFFGFAANLFSALIAYTFYPKKPHMRGIDLSNAFITI